MKMDVIAGSKNDEYYTPKYAIVPLVKYLKPKATIWCPFDTEHSWFVKTFKEAGFDVIHTHISNEEDFFKITPPECDYIISNPPYSLKTEVLIKLFGWGKPFAMLVGVVGLFESQRRFELFRDNQFEIMYFNRRVKFFKDFEEQKPSVNPPFSSVFVTSGVLPMKTVFEELN